MLQPRHLPDGGHPGLGVQQREDVVRGARGPDHHGDVEHGAREQRGVHGHPQPRQQGAELAVEREGGQAGELGGGGHE